MKNWLFGLVYLVTIQFYLDAQPDPHFSPFQGTIYDIPEDWLEEGYGPHVDYFDKLGQVTLDSLMVPKSRTRDQYFPRVPYPTRFGIIFHSEVQIAQRGCYEFYLESDDGSILWISDSLIIDNDKPHRMTIKRDSIMLSKGQFPVKLWYYSAFHTEFGLIFRSRALPDSSYCQGFKPRQELLTFDANAVFFEFDSHIISEEGRHVLDRMCLELNGRDFNHILVVGYTDNVGTKEYNKALSQKRAESITAYMKTKITKPGISFTAEGRGVYHPGSEYQNSAEQLQHRRVEIYIER